MAALSIIIRSEHSPVVATAPLNWNSFILIWLSCMETRDW